MSRRRLVAIISAGVMLLIGLTVVGIVLATTQTDYGRDRIQRVLNARLVSAMQGRGRIYIGRIRGGLVNGVVIDSLEIRDADDSIFVATGPIRAAYDPRDIFDKRLLFSSVEIDRPLVNLRRHADRSWNFRRIFGEGGGKPQSAERRYGDFIVADSVTIRDATLLVTEPWHPADSLRGAKLDSAVRYALNDTTRDIRRTSEGLKRTRRWTHLQLVSPWVRIADPDSGGQHIVLGSAAAKENDPPFDFRNMRGDVHVLGDSVAFVVSHVDLPGSTARGTGRVWWHGSEPVQYDVSVVGDSVSLDDIAWVYPTLPTTGGGRMKLRIRNEQGHPDVLDYAISDMDVSTTRSRLTGDMTFAVGYPVLVVKDLDLRADPVDFDLLRTFNGKPFPVDWQGTFTGTVRGPGGPLTAFRVSDARLTFRDRHVPGATSTFAGRGGLDILRPAEARFLGFDLTSAAIDLRSVEYLFPSFPRLRGIVDGSARLDSVWTDVRFSNADLTHRDGADAPSRVTGSGRVTYGTRFMAFDVDLNADPLSFTTLARSYPALAVRGPYSGPIHVDGTMPDLGLAGTLTGAAGTMAVDGRFDFDTTDGIGGRGTVSARGLDVRTLLERPALVDGRLTGAARLDVHGRSLADVAGTLAITLDSSRVDRLHLGPGMARLALGGGRVRVDSLALATAAGPLTAVGALGLVPAVTDSLRFVLAIDSLGGLRPYLRRPPTRRGAVALASTDTTLAEPERALLARALRDSVAGTIRATGFLVGSIDTVAARGTFDGRRLFVGGDEAQHLAGDFALEGLPFAPRGTASVRLDSLLVAGVRVDSAAAALAMRDSANGRLTMRAATNAPAGAFAAGAGLAFARRADSLVLTVDSLGLRTAQSAPWTLAAPTRVSFDSLGTTIDSVVVRNGQGGRAALVGRFPNELAVHATLALDSIPLADLSVLAQTRTPMAGWAAGIVTADGPRLDPVLRFAGRFGDVRYGEMHVPVFTVRAHYAARRLADSVVVFRDDRPVMTLDGALPFDLALASVPNRLLDDTLSQRIRADSVDLALVEAITPLVTSVRGTASAALDVGGTWHEPALAGRVQVHDGEMGLPRLGIRLRRLTADVGFAGDTIIMHRLSAQSGSQPADTMSLVGTVRLPHLTDPRDATFDLTMRARSFQAVDKRSLARLELSGDLRLRGPLERATLSGLLSVERGTLFLSDLAQKQIVSLDPDSPDLYSLVDTNLVSGRGVLGSSIPPYLRGALNNLRTENLEVRIGDDVWLKSQEASIKLAGSVDLSDSTTGAELQRGLTGRLRVQRGTYRLDLGLVQRTFQVDSGTVTFFGDPSLPAALDITASYTVRQANRQGQDVRIIARIGGTLADPRLTLASDTRYQLSESEILSYLVFGTPEFAVDPTGNRALQPVAQALLPTLGGIFERALADQVGFFDLVQIQTGAVGETQSFFSPQGSTNVLAGSRIGIGKQLGDRTFVMLNAGLCQLAGQRSATNFTSTLGVSIEQQLNYGFSIQASVEPSSQGLLCSAVGIGNRPNQVGFDLFREWSF